MAAPTYTTRQGDPRVVLSAYLPVELAAKLKAQAKVERRSLSAVIRNACEDHLRAEDRQR